MKFNRTKILIIIPLILLSIPAIAMLFTDEVNWTVCDFVIMGILLYGTALICELILRMSKSLAVKIVLCSITVILLLLVWAELAVGIFNFRKDAPV